MFFIDIQQTPNNGIVYDHPTLLTIVLDKSIQIKHNDSVKDNRKLKINIHNYSFVSVVTKFVGTDPKAA